MVIFVVLRDISNIRMKFGLERSLAGAGAGNVSEEPVVIILVKDSKA